MFQRFDEREGTESILILSFCAVFPSTIRGCRSFHFVQPDEKRKSDRRRQGFLEVETQIARSSAEFNFWKLEDSCRD